MKISKLTLLFVGLGLTSIATNAQKKDLFQFVEIDSLNIITPLVDANRRDADAVSIPDTALNKNLRLYLISILEEQLQKPNYTRLARLENLNSAEFSKITHFYLSWAIADRYKQLWRAPEVTITQNHKYSLMIAISGYYGNSYNNGVYNHLSIINNHTKKIIYQDSKRIANSKITDRKAVLYTTKKLIERYLATSPSLLKPR
ncbi:MAG: hypothetical protein EOP00_33925 [Pedobacter sp.]|nr:MAG: hypothetical protein EOP00_33925 [Pedobacter sp.]